MEKLMEGMDERVPLKSTGEWSETTNVTYDFDKILEYIGNMGRYQALLAVFAVYLSIPVGMHEVGAVFLLGVPQHRCHLPGLDGSPTSANCSDQYLLNISTPPVANGYNGCKMFDRNYSTCCDESLHCSDLPSNVSLISCESYVYKSDVFGNTMVTEWDLVCDRRILRTSATAVMYVGSLLGSLIAGNISDNFGRLPPMMIGTLLILASGIACVFSQSLVMVSVTRFLIAVGGTVTFSVGFVYAMEIVFGKWRVVIGTAYHSAYAIGYTILSAMAYIWRDWKDLQLAISLVSAPFLLMWPIMLESPRWLFTNGRCTKAKENSILMAKRNGVNLPEDVWSKSLVQKEADTGRNYYSTVTLFKTRGIRRVTLITTFCWFVVSLTYYGLSLNVGSLSGDVYVNNALSGIAEIVACPISILVLNRLGRPVSACVSFVLAGFMCVAASVVNYCWPAFGAIGTALALLGKLAISVSYSIIYVFSSELYPTVLRATAISFGSLASVIAVILSPYTLFLQYYLSWLPGIIFGFTSILAGLSSLKLRETRDRMLMTTISEAEEFFS